MPNEYSWDIQEHGVTQSVLGLFALCPHKANLKIKQGLGFKNEHGPMSPIGFGDFFHRCLDGVYTMLKDSEYGIPPEDLHYLAEDVTDIMYDTDKAKMHDSMSSPSDHAQLELMYGQARVLIVEYFKYYAKHDVQLKWRSLEEMFQVPYKLNDEVTIPVRGKYDGIFEYKGGTWLFETKTKSFIDDSSISDKLNYDLQVMLYLWSMRTTYGVNPKGVLYNCVRRPALRQKLKEPLTDFLQRIKEDVESRPDYYFVRYEARITDGELDAWVKHDFNGLMEQIWLWSQGHFNFRNSGACNMWNRKCEFMQVCAYNNYQGLGVREHTFPELQQPGGE